MKIFIDIATTKSLLIMILLMAAWVLSVLMMPKEIMMVIYAGVASWSIGKFIAHVPSILSKETNKDSLKNMFELADGMHNLINEMFASLIQCRNTMAAQQAKIDALMLEYCPEEMTPEQIANYEAHQKRMADEQFNASLH